jgi:hypothetical protein
VLASRTSRGLRPRFIQRQNIMHSIAQLRRAGYTRRSKLGFERNHSGGQYCTF